MPWKQGYTISDEIGIKDADIRWPGGQRCCLSIVVDLSVASGPAGVTAHDLVQPTSLFGMGEGLDQILGLLRRFGRKVAFVAPAVMAEAYPDRIDAVLRDGHEIAAGGLAHLSSFPDLWNATGVGMRSALAGSLPRRDSPPSLPNHLEGSRGQPQLSCSRHASCSLIRVELEGVSCDAECPL